MLGVNDGCPWGLGGVRFAEGKPVAWFACPLSEDDLRRFQAVRGESAFNTTWEALALLVACRIWLGDDSTQAIVEARVRSDSLSALRSMAKMSSSAPGLNLIARELAIS